MYPLDPGTVSGMIQREVQNVERQVREKADSHEVYTLKNDASNLEHTVRELSATLDGIRYELQALTERVDEDDES